MLYAGRLIHYYRSVRPCMTLGILLGLFPFEGRGYASIDEFSGFVGD